MSNQLCGKPANGGPCTMKKDHPATWHRHVPATDYIEWEIYARHKSGITDINGAKKLSTGKNKQELYSAINAALTKHDNINLYINLVRA